MKKLILAAFAVTAAVSVFAQGTVQFVNNNSIGTSRVWGPSATNVFLSLQGNATSDIPAGSTDYAGHGMVKIGTTGLVGPFGGSTTLAQLLGANNGGQAESSLVPQGQTTTFRTGSPAGIISLITDTLTSVPKDSLLATFEMVAWDDSSTLYPTWTEAFPAWTKGLIAAGKSGAFNVQSIGGDSNSPPNMQIPSFNMYMILVPEPSTFALAGMGLAALVAFRRRNQ